jgi:acyl-CoA thioesterase II
MGSALDALVELLDLERLEVNLFRGVSPEDDRQRVFGGQVAGQALVAAGRTVDASRPVHSLHAYFLRPGDPSVPIVYEVDRIRDGKSFTTRRVVAIQHGKAIFNLAASFHHDEPGFDHQVTMPEAPPPESLRSWSELAAAEPARVGSRSERDHPIDVRYVGPPPWLREAASPHDQLIWIRADGELPDDANLHACVVAYASDLTLLDSALAPHGISWFQGDVMTASLDHAMWFHRPFRADQWLLYSQFSPATSGARGFAAGGIFTREGELVVSVAQEGLVRPVRPRA